MNADDPLQPIILPSSLARKRGGATSASRCATWVCGGTLLVGLAFPAAGADEALPAAQPITRYEKMLARSPFSPPTAGAPPPVPSAKQPGWSDELFVSGVMAMGASNIVTLTNRSDAQRFTIASGETSPQGVSVVNVQWSEQLGQTRVTVKKGTEFAVLLFDQAMLAQRGGAPAPPQGIRPPNPAQPLQPQPQGQARPPLPLPGQPTPIPGSNYRPPGSNPPFPFPVPNANPNPEPTRQRTRPIIQSTPNALPTLPPANRLPANNPVID